MSLRAYFHGTYELLEKPSLNFNLHLIYWCINHHCSLMCWYSKNVHSFLWRFPSDCVDTYLRFTNNCSMVVLYRDSNPPLHPKDKQHDHLFLLDIGNLFVPELLGYVFHPIKSIDVQWNNLEVYPYKNPSWWIVDKMLYIPSFYSLSNTYRG